MIADGRRIEPIQLGADRVAFMIPAGCAEARLASRTCVPAWMVAESCDERRLGICVRRLQIDGECIALDSPSLPARGWNRFEAREGSAGHRWTSGDAALPANARLIVIDYGECRAYADDAVEVLTPDAVGAMSEARLRLVV